MLVRSVNRSLIALVFDLASTLLAVLLASWARLYLPLGIPLPDLPWWPALLGEALLIYPFVFLALSVYAPENERSESETFRRLVIACLVAGLALAGLMFFSQRENSRLYLVEFYVIHYILISGWRLVYYTLGRQKRLPGLPLARVILVGEGEGARQAMEKLCDLARGETLLVGYLSVEPDALKGISGAPYLGRPEDAPRLVGELALDDVLIALPASAYMQVQSLVSALLDRPCSIWLVPDYFNLLFYGAHVRSLDGLPLISLKAPTLTPNQRLLKRAFDLILGGVLILVAAPLLGVAALAIRLDSPGPVVLRQVRVGENGRLFEMLKFRSMVAGAEKLPIQAKGTAQPSHKLPHDSRVTRVGRGIRRMSIDELPQLFNVLKGEMSLVGPRPELPELVERYEPWQRKRFAVPQGMTGWWQVNGRSDRPMHLNTEYDLYYIQNYSLILDIQILLRTIGTVIRGKGAF